MSRTDPQYRFRPPPELAAQLDAYCLRERRRSVNEALIVLVSMALEHDREARARLEGTQAPPSGRGIGSPTQRY